MLNFVRGVIVFVFLVSVAGPSTLSAQYSPQGKNTYDGGASEEIFDRVRETGHLCMDGFATRLLSTDRRPAPESCSAYYAACEGDDCMFVIRGSLKKISKQALLDRGVFLEERLKRLEESGQTAQFFPINPTWPAAGFVDPVCSYYHQLGFDCPDAPGLPGGGSSPPPGSGTPGTPGPNDNCWLCTAEYGLCFVQAQKGIINHVVCISRFQQCAARRCG